MVVGVVITKERVSAWTKTEVFGVLLLKIYLCAISGSHRTIEQI